jgi:CRISPR-associated protein Cas2
MKKSHIVIVYDSDNDSDRRRVRSAIRAFGGWKQYSVFECLLTETGEKELLARLRDIVADASGETRIRWYRLAQPEENILTIPSESKSPDSAENII